MSDLIIEEFTAWQSLSAFRREWNGLVRQQSLGPAHEFDWLETVWEVNKSNRRLLVLLLRDDQGIAGIAPLVKETERRKGLQVRIVHALSGFHSLHGTQMILARNQQALLSQILGHLQKKHADWTLWFMQYQSGEGQEALFRRGLEEYRYAYESHSAPRSPYMRIEESWEDKMKSLQPRFRTSLRSREKRIRERGQLELRFLDSPQQSQAGLEAIREIEEDSWKISAGSAITAQDFQWQFYSRYAPLAAAKGTLRIPVLFLDNEPLAYDYALFDSGIYYLLKTSYKQKWHELYPGFVLRKMMVEWAYAQGAREIDFLGKDEEWKMKWTDTVRAHSDYFVYSRTWGAHYLRGVRRLKSFLKREG